MLNLTLKGGKKLQDQLAAYPDVAASVVGVKVASLSLKLQAHVQLDKLSGQVLKIRSGDLKASITNEYTADGLNYRGRIFSSGDVKYAAFWEFGFTGTERVKAFERLVKADDLRRGFKLVQPVREHTRQVNQPARSFMRSALADMAEEITREIKKAAVQSVAKSCGKAA